MKHIFLLLILLPKIALAECVLDRPGPFLDKSKGSQVKTNYQEESTDESMDLPSGEFLRATSYGCDKTWGWGFSLDVKGAKPKSLKATMEWARVKVLPNLLEAPKKEYKIEKHWDSAVAMIKADELNHAFLCVGYNKKKECTIKMDVSLSGTVLKLTYDDLEN